MRYRYMENGGGDRYAYPYRTYVKPSPMIAVKSPGLIDPSQILNGGTDVFAVNHVVPEGTVQVVKKKNGNGETVQIALDENGEVIATKKEPPNILPVALAAAAAWFFLM